MTNEDLSHIDYSEMLSAREAMLVIEAIHKHNVRFDKVGAILSTKLHLQEKEKEREHESRRDSKGRFVKLIVIEGENFEIDLHYNKSGSCSSIEWELEKNFSELD